MNKHSRTNGARDTEISAETVIESSSLLRKAISNMDNETRKTVSSQQSETISFDNYIEKRSKQK